jgi:hypothetical protein
MQVNVVGTLMFLISIAIVLGAELRSRQRARSLARPTRNEPVLPEPTLGEELAARRPS